MANHGGSSSSEDLHTVFVDTNLDTHLLLAVRNDDRISDFKVKFCEEHQNCFSEVGKIRVSAVKVKHREQFYSLIDSMRMGLAFDGVETDWDLHVDVVVVNEDEIIGIMDVDQNCSDPDLLDEKKEPGSDSILVTWHTEDPSLEEEDAKTVVKKTKKRKMESSDGKRGRKKRAVDVNRSSVEVDASQSCEVSSREKPDDIIMGAICEDIEREKKNDISMEENQQTSEADKPCQEKFISVNSEHVDGHSRGEVKDLEGNQTLESCGKIPIEELDGLKGVNIDVEKGEETTELVKMDQEKNIMTTLVTARDDVNGSHEKLDGLVSGVIEKDNEIGEGSRLAPSAAANLQSVDLITYSENQLETSSNLTTGQATEKKKKKKKSSKDHIDQSADPVITAASDIVNTDPILRKETLENLPVEAIQKEKEMGEKSVKDLETNSGMTISPVTEKKKKRKKSSKDHINQSSSVPTTTSKETMNEINRVPENVDHVDALPESFPISKRGKLGNPIAEERQQDNETGEKMDVDMGSEKAIPTAADIVQTDTFVSDPVNKMEGSSVLAAGPAIEKKRKHKKSTKEKTTQSTADTTISKVNEREKVSGSIDRVASDSGAEKRADTLVNAIETENEMTDNQQVAVFESTPVCEVGKLNDENISREHEVPTDNNGEIDAGEAKSVKSLKKKSSRKSKTPAKDDTLVASGAQNVEPIIKAVDGEEPKNLIKKNKTEENLNKSAKKSSKKSKKNDSLNNVDAQVLSVEVNNTAQKEVPLISNTKDTDASLFTPAKKDTTSFLKKHNDKVEDNSPSKQIVKENVDIGDNFGSSQKETITGGDEKQDQVTGETKSIKAKKSRDLHPGGSIDGSLSSMKPKERKGKVQPASLQSSVKYDRNVSKLDRSVASKKVAVNNKNEALKKSSNSAAVKKGAMSFFKDSEWDSTDDESKKTLPASGVSTKAPSDSSSGDDSDDDSDVTSISRKQENNVSGGTNGLSGSLQDILRSSKSFKMAKLRASQSLPDVYDDDLPAVDCVPDSQAN